MGWSDSLIILISIVANIEKRSHDAPIPLATSIPSLARAAPSAAHMSEASIRLATSMGGRQKPV